MGSILPVLALPSPHGHLPVVDAVGDRSSLRTGGRAPIPEPHRRSEAGKIRTRFAGLARRTVEHGEVPGTETWACSGIRPTRSKASEPSPVESRCTGVPLVRATSRTASISTDRFSSRSTPMATARTNSPACLLATPSCNRNRQRRPGALGHARILPTPTRAAPVRRCGESAATPPASSGPCAGATPPARSPGSSRNADRRVRPRPSPTAP